MLFTPTKIETLEQASQIAQDIEISLRFSSERRVIPKTGKQHSPKTHATRDPKGKSVIGKSSKNTKGSQCFKYQGYDHIVAQCPSRNLLVRKVDDEIETAVYEPTDSATDSDDVTIFSIQLSAVRCSQTVVRDKDWRRCSCSTPKLHTKEKL